MKKRFVAFFLVFALMLPILPVNGVLVGANADVSVLLTEISSAKSLLYKGNSEQSRKYLADRIERAEAVALSVSPTTKEIDGAISSLKYAVSVLDDMYAFESVELNGFSAWTKEDLSSMVESVGELSIDETIRPEGVAFSISVTPSGDGAVLSNGATRSSVAGESPFGKEMLKADGIKFWVSVSEATSFDVSIGVRGSGNSVFTATDINVAETGYVYIPFDVFTTPGKDSIAKDGSLNFIRIESLSGKGFAVADFSAYNEILETSTATEYKEERITSRGEIVNGGYYKIIDIKSGKAVTLTPECPETAIAWDDTTINITDNRPEFVLEDNVEGANNQLWQFYPSPDGSGSYFIINKSYSNAIEITSTGGGITNKPLNFNTEAQRWNISSTKGEFTLQVRGVGKLTTAADTVKATASNTFKKFHIYKVTEREYTEIWSDEFDGPELDRSKWATDDGFYFGGSVTSLGTDDPENIYFENGEMVMSVKYDNYDDGYQFKSMYMSTSGKFAMSYGKIEIRAKLAYGNGQFPAFWLMPSDLMNMGAGEIDIMELSITDDIYQNSVQIGTIHWTTDDGYTHYSKPYYMPIYGAGDDVYISDDYHTYGVEMDHDQVRYYFDGAQYMSLNINTSGKEYAFGDIARYIIINNTTKGDNYCIVEDDWTYEDEYVTKIDYVKCYLESGEVSAETEDYTTEDSTVYSEGIDAVLTHRYWDVNFPMDIKPDGTEGIAGSDNGLIYVFDPNTNVTLKSIDINPIQRPHRVLYSPDGSRVAIATSQGCIVIFDTSDYNKAPVKIYNGAVIQENVLFSADGSQLIVGGFNGGSQIYKNPITGGTTEKWCFRVFDVETGEKLQDIYVGSDPRYIDLSNDGSKVAVTTTNNGTFIYNTSDWSEYAHLEGELEYAIRAADFSPDDKLLVTSDEGGKIVVWDVEAKKVYNVLNNVNTASVRRILFSPDGKNVLASATHGAARLFDVESGELVSLLGGFDGAIREMVYSPNGEYIVLSGYDQKNKVFSADGTYLETLATDDYIETGYIISKIRFTPDGSHVFISLRNYPNFIQKWEMPASVDKTALEAELLKATPGTEAYEYATDVVNNDYVSAATVNAAMNKLLGTETVAANGSIYGSVDGYNHSSEGIAINRGGYAYLKVVTSTAGDDYSLRLTDATDAPSKIISLDDVIVLDSEVTYESVTRYLKVKIEEGGNYDIDLISNFDGSVLNQAPYKVSVDFEKYETDDFLYSINNGEVTIERGISGERIVNIPDYIEGYPVTKIAPYAFYQYGRIITHVEITLPSTLKEIGDYAFYSVNSLRRIEFPEGLEKIGMYAFYDCRLLGVLDIPVSVKEIGSYAFARTGIGTMYVNSNSTPLSNYTQFSGNYRIRHLIYANGLTEITGSLSQQFLMESIYIPESVTKIQGTIFYDEEEIVTIYGIPGSYAQAYAETNPERFVFVPIAAPVISGVEEGATYDLYTAENAISASWDNGHAAYLNGKSYIEGNAITEPGEYTLTVVNGYDKYSTSVSFTVVDTTPPPYTLGDMDNDGEISVADALAILRIVAKLAEAEGNQALAADINKDNVIAVDDALAVLRYVAKLTDTLE